MLQVVLTNWSVFFVRLCQRAPITVSGLCHVARSPFWVEGGHMVVLPKATSSDKGDSTESSRLVERLKSWGGM